MDKISGIYKIVNKVNGKYYIGSSGNIIGYKDSRWGTHLRHLKANKHDNSHLQHAWNKYGESNFELFIIEKVSNDKLLIREQVYLDLAKGEKIRCYNLGFIAGKVEMTEEIKNKIRRSNTGKHHSDETKSLIRKNHARLSDVNHPWFGKHHTSESLQKIKNAQVGRVGINAAHYGKYHSDETKKLIKEKTLLNTPRGKNHPNYDTTVYTFKNKITDEVFLGTQFEFRNKYNFSQSKTNRFVCGHRKSYRKWIILQV